MEASTTNSAAKAGFQSLDAAALAADPSSSSILLCSILFFLLQYAVAWSVCYRKWRGHKRMRACSCTISFTHSLIASVISLLELYTVSWGLDTPNTSLQNRIMEWSMAFFTVDLLHYAVAAPSDYLFISHHLATLLYLLSCRYYAHAGAKSAICMLAAGEITTPLQSVWTISRLRRDQSRTADKLYTVLSPVFTVAFTLVRGVMGPYLWWKLLKFYVWNHSSHSIPTWLAFCWMVKVTIGIIGSIIWVYKLWCGLLTFYLHRLRIFRTPARGRRYDD